MWYGKSDIHATGDIRREMRREMRRRGAQQAMCYVSALA